MCYSILVPSSTLVLYFVTLVRAIPVRAMLGNWSKQVCSKRTHLVWGREGGGGGVIGDTTYLVNITDKLL